MIPTLTQSHLVVNRELPIADDSQPPVINTIEFNRSVSVGKMMPLPNSRVKLIDSISCFIEFVCTNSTNVIKCCSLLLMIMTDFTAYLPADMN